MRSTKLKMASVHLVIGVAVLLCLALSAQADDSPESLLRLYREYELPIPPKGAQLAVMEPAGVYISNGVRQRTYHLVLMTTPATKAGKAVYKIGLRDTTAARGEQFRIVEQRADIVEKTTPNDPAPWRHAGFPTFPDLALAIQCQALGWDGVALKLLERSRKPRSETSDRVPSRPRDDRLALAQLGWNYWCDEFAKAKPADRRILIRRMKRLVDSQPKMSTKANLTLIEDMERTLAVRDVPAANSLEAEIESLLELAVKGGWPARGNRFSIGNHADRNPHYRKLRERALEAVPVLIYHLDDFRLTRCIERTRQNAYTWHVRIADVVALLLDGVGSEPFAFDFLQREGRGRRLDRGHVEFWRKQAAVVAEVDYLLKHAVVKKPDGIVLSDQMLRVLGRRYPEEFVTLFKKYMKEPHDRDSFFEALGESKVPAETKAALLLIPARGDDEWKRVWALHELVGMKHPEAVPALIASLKRIPKTPKDAYWTSNAESFAWVATLCDDADAWKALQRTAKRVDIGQRLQMLQAVGQCRKRRTQAIGFLTSFLGDKCVRVINNAFTEGLFRGPCAGFIFPRLVVRDFAALQLTHLLDIDVDADSSWKKADWEKLHNQVAAALANRKLAPKKEGSDEK